MANSRIFTYRRMMMCIYVAVVLLTLFGFILPFTLKNFMFSKLYEKNGEDARVLEMRVLEKNDKRWHESEKYFQGLNNNKSLHFYRKYRGSRWMPNVVIAVVTVLRNNNVGGKLAYLTQTLAAFDRELRKSDVYNITMFICNTNSPAEKHEEAIYLSSYVPIVSRYTGKNLDWDGERSGFEKEKRDYIFCLETAVSLASKYVLIVQDDAIPRDDFFIFLEYVIQQKLERCNEDESQWALCKLYYPERWQGFQSSIQSVAELTALVLIFGSLSVCFGFFKFRTGLDGNRAYMYFIFFLTGTVFTVSAWLVGRQYFLELRKFSKHLYSLIPAFKCCIPAVLYPKSRAKQLAKFLDNEVCSSNYPVDLAIDKFTLETGLKQYLVEPNLFQHIGMYSSLGSRPKAAIEFL